MRFNKPRFAAITILFFICLAGSRTCAKDTVSEGPEGIRWYESLDVQLGGHARLRGTVSWPDDDSVYQLIGTDPYYDGNAELRTTLRVLLKNLAYVEAHYETVALGGDTRRRTSALRSFFSDFGVIRSVGPTPLDDDRRLLDLTKTFHQTDSSVWYHRLDRLSFTWQPRWGTVRIGRQAITWGNGLIFNPMDLFNPFAPTDIERDYKIGDDMVLCEIPLGMLSSMQLLCVSRRNPATGAATGDQSSAAAKLHLAAGTTEFDFMASRHYEDYVIGMGSTGYVKNAAWRCDATWTFLKGKDSLGGFLSLVANMDYSWLWRSKNVYGLVECYYSGVGESHGDYAEGLRDPFLSERLARGELFSLGRFYATGTIGIELHPLFNTYCTIINNLSDPSGIMQPRAVWDITTNMEITCGANILYGAKDTEFGGFTLPGTDYLLKAAHSAYVWVSYYF